MSVIPIIYNACGASVGSEIGLRGVICRRRDGVGGFLENKSPDSKSYDTRICNLCIIDSLYRSIKLGNFPKLRRCFTNLNFGVGSSMAWKRICISTGDCRAVFLVIRLCFIFGLKGGNYENKLKQSFAKKHRLRILISCCARSTFYIACIAQFISVF